MFQMVAGDPALIYTFQEPEKEEKKGSPSAFKDNFPYLHLITMRTQAHGYEELQRKLTNVVYIQGEVCPAKCQVNLKAKWRMDI